MYAVAPQQLTRSAMTQAEQRRHQHLAEVSAAKRADAAAVSYRTRGRRRALGPRLRLLLHLS